MYSSHILIQGESKALFSHILDDAFHLFEKLEFPIGFYYDKHLYVVENIHDRYRLLDQYNDRNLTGTQLVERLAHKQRS